MTTAGAQDGRIGRVDGAVVGRAAEQHRFDSRRHDTEYATTHHDGMHGQAKQGGGQRQRGPTHLDKGTSRSATEIRSQPANKKSLVQV